MSADAQSDGPHFGEFQCKSLREVGGGAGQVWALVLGHPEFGYLKVASLQPDGKIIFDLSKIRNDVPAGDSAIEVELVTR